MEQASLIDSALKIIFFDNDIENGRRPAVYRGIFASGDLEVAFAVAEAHHSVDLDVSLDRAVDNLAGRNLSATCELFEPAKAVNTLRRSKGTEYLGHFKRTMQTFVGHKRKYDELRDQTEREVQLRAATKRANDMFGREERAKRRDGLKELESQLDKKNQDLATAQSSLQRERIEVKRLEQSLQCGHLFCAECIKQWLEDDCTWMHSKIIYQKISPARRLNLRILYQNIASLLITSAILSFMTLLQRAGSPLTLPLDYSQIFFISTTLSMIVELCGWCKEPSTNG